MRVLYYLTIAVSVFLGFLLVDLVDRWKKQEIKNPAADA